MFLRFFPLYVDCMLHILHQDHRISPQICCSIPVEVALPGRLLAGDSARKRMSEGTVYGCNFGSLDIYVVVASPFWSAMKIICPGKPPAYMRNLEVIALLILVFNLESV